MHFINILFNTLCVCSLLASSRASNLFLIKAALLFPFLSWPIRNVSIRTNAYLLQRLREFPIQLSRASLLPAQIAISQVCEGLNCMWMASLLNKNTNSKLQYWIILAPILKFSSEMLGRWTKSYYMLVVHALIILSIWSITRYLNKQTGFFVFSIWRRGWVG